MRKKGVRILIGTLGLGLGVYLLYNIFSQTDVAASAALLSNISTGGLLLILLPTALGVGFDAIGWRYLLPEKVDENSFPVTFWRIMRVRMASESVVSTVPMGAVIADPLKAWLLKRYFGLSLACGSASVALRTFLLGDSQAILVLLVTLGSFAFVSEVSLRLLHDGLLAWIVIGVALAAMGLYTTLIITTSSGKLSQRVHQLLTKIRIRKLKVWLESQDAHFLELHHELASFGGDRRGMMRLSFLLYLLMWSMECVETYLIFQFIGAPITLLEAFTIEAVCGFIRSVAFVIPAGLGAQDAGYAAFLSQAGETQGVAVAFILMKRVRQLLWVLFGAVFLFKFRRSDPMPVGN